MSHYVASMRPAHSAREIGHRPRARRLHRRRFNEARAFSAGNRPASQGVDAPTPRFNEARAFSAGNHAERACGWRWPRRFNEARAFSAGNRGNCPILAWYTTSFNEARAFSAGNPCCAAAGLARRVASMRPAHSAREIPKEDKEKVEVKDASMRPAHSAREIRISSWTCSEACNCFNEARAFSAGNLKSSSFKFREG